MPKKFNNMKQIYLLLTYIMVGVTMLTACQSDDADADTPTLPARRTVVVYVSGENNLSGYSQSDINEMLRGRQSAPANDNLVLFVDKASSTEKPYIAKITADGKVEKLHEYSEDFLASDPERMAEVLKRCIALCPATDDYGLVLWGHAGGWIIEKDSVAHSNAQTPSLSNDNAQSARRAYGLDSGDNTATMKGKWINISSLRQVLKQVGVTWKFIFCDCCNMANVETAYELRDATPYLIGSAAEIPGKGAPYTTLVKDFFKYDDKEMYTSICDDYYAQIDEGNGHTPMAVIKTSQLQALAQATRPLLTKVNDYLKTLNSTKGMIYYYAYDRSKEMEKTLYDMNDVIRTAIGADAAEYKMWKEAFDQAVVYSKLSANWYNKCIVLSDFSDGTTFKHGNESYGGMSMFFPMEKYNNPGMSHAYNETIKKTAWYYAVGWSEVGW